MLFLIISLDNDESQEMFLSTEINIWEWDSNKEEWINKNDCLHNRLNENNNEIINLSLSDWSEIKDKD